MVILVLFLRCLLCFIWCREQKSSNDKDCICKRSGTGGSLESSSKAFGCQDSCSRCREACGPCASAKGVIFPCSSGEKFSLVDLHLPAPGLIYRIMLGSIQNFHVYSCAWNSHLIMQWFMTGWKGDNNFPHEIQGFNRYSSCNFFSSGTWSLLQISCHNFKVYLYYNIMCACHSTRTYFNRNVLMDHYFLLFPAFLLSLFLDCWRCIAVYV